MKRGFILLCLNTLLCACTPSMPLVKSSPTIDIANGMGVGIFTMEIRNDYKNYAPQPISLTVKNTDTRSNVDTQSFSFGDPEKELGERGYEMTASVALPAGEYYITELAGVARSFPIAGRFYFNPNKRFILKSGELTYLGHLVARLVERTYPFRHTQGKSREHLRFEEDFLDGGFGMIRPTKQLELAQVSNRFNVK